MKIAGFEIETFKSFVSGTGTHLFTQCEQPVLKRKI